MTLSTEYCQKPNFLIKKEKHQELTMIMNITVYPRTLRAGNKPQTLSK